MEMNYNKPSVGGKKAVDKKTILIGCALLVGCILVALLLVKPELFAILTQSPKDVLKGIGLGLCILPIMLFVTMKGGADWHKQKWTWALLVVAFIFLFVMVFLMQSSGSSVNAFNSYNGMPMMY